MLASPDNGVPVLKTAEARRRRVLMPLFILGVVALIAWLLLGRSGQGGFTGAGSTLAQPLIQQAAHDFRSSVQADNPERRDQTGVDWVVDGTGIDYEPVGSLGGIMRLSDPDVDFAVADYPLSAAGLSERKVAQFPIAVGAITVVANLELPRGEHLRLNADTVARIYLGEITSWRDPAIAELNPGLDLPDLAVSPVHRSDGSGSTLGFTRFLSDGSAAWRSGPGSATRITWPAGTPAERSSGLIAAVTATRGALGYVEFGQARRAGLTAAALAAGGDAFVQPSPETMQHAIEGADWSAATGYTEPISLTETAQAYPLTVPIYALVRAEDRYAAERDRALRFLRYVVDEYDGAAEDLGYLPLPAAAATAVKDHWNATMGVSL